MEIKNKQRIIYWTLTLPIALIMLTLSYGYLTANPRLVEAVSHLGYPLYFMTLLGVAKLLGAAAILYGRFRTLAEWAYAGFAFTLISAAFSHFSLGDGALKVMLPIAVFGALLCSHWYWKHGVREREQTVTHTSRANVGEARKVTVTPTLVEEGGR